MRWKTLAASAILMLGASVAVAQEDASQDDGQDGSESDIGYVGALHPAEGAETTFDYCASCHSEMMVAQQGQTRKGWDELLVWMVEKQGMEPIPEEDREIILDYLAEHYNTDRPHFPDRG